MIAAPAGAQNPAYKSTVKRMTMTNGRGGQRLHRKSGKNYPQRTDKDSSRSLELSKASRPHCRGLSEKLPLFHFIKNNTTRTATEQICRIAATPDAPEVPHSCGFLYPKISAVTCGFSIFMNFCNAPAVPPQANDKRKTDRQRLPRAAV